MNNRIKKKLNNRLNYKKYANAPNVAAIITDRNKYHKRHIGLIRFLNGTLFDEDDMVVFRSKPKEDENEDI